MVKITEELLQKADQIPNFSDGVIMPDGDYRLIEEKGHLQTMMALLPYPEKEIWKMIPENDSALDIEGWTGHSGCIILAPHLVNLTKKEVGLPPFEEATERQKRDGMCWKDEHERYNDGKAFKITASLNSPIIGSPDRVKATAPIAPDVRDSVSARRIAVDALWNSSAVPATRDPSSSSANGSAT